MDCSDSLQVCARTAGSSFGSRDEDTGVCSGSSSTGDNTRPASSVPQVRLYWATHAGFVPPTSWPLADHHGPWVRYEFLRAVTLNKKATTRKGRTEEIATSPQRSRVPTMRTLLIFNHKLLRQLPECTVCVCQKKKRKGEQCNSKVSTSR